MHSSANVIIDANVPAARLRGQLLQTSGLSDVKMQSPNLACAPLQIALFGGEVRTCASSSMSLSPILRALRPKRKESSIRPAMNQKSAAASVSPPTIDPVLSTPVDTREAVCAVAHEVMGTIIDMNAPLMSAGLDSLAAVELVSTLASRLKVDIESTALFDYPTLDSLANFVSSKLAANTMVEAPT